MQLVESTNSQLHNLPLPSASLVIDVRGVDDDLLKMLEIEIENLASEMGMHNINHWRYLTRFLAFKSLAPLLAKEINHLRSLTKSPNGHQSNSPANGQSAAGVQADTSQGKLKTVLGVTDQRDQHRFFPVRIFRPDAQSTPVQGPNDEFLRNVKECIQEIDYVRNERIKATGDFGKDGKAGRNTRDPIVYVIFLTDAERPDSLSSAAAYASYLKEYYRRLEHSGHQSVLSTTVICLDHDNQATAPMSLINRLCWEGEGNEWAHLDSIILSEKYREDAGRVIGSMQAYVAELLLYTLLIIPPPEIRPAAPDLEEHFPSPPHTKARRNLHPNTYLVGLSAIEYSVRWGRRLLNYGLAEHIVQVLQDRAIGDEQARIAGVVERWLSDWRVQVIEAVPDHVPGAIPALGAFAAAVVAAKPADEVFTSRRPSLRMGDATVQGLQHYVTSVARTYTLLPGEREAMRAEVQAASAQQKPVPAPTMRDALESIPVIEQSMGTWESDYPGTPLAEAQKEAKGVLGHPHFFLGAHGAIPRAKLQLKELARAIGEFQSRHRQTSIDLEERRRSFVQFSEDRLKDVRAHASNFPLLAAVMNLKRPMAWLTLLLVLILGMGAIVTGFAWLGHLAFLLLPGLAAALDGTLFTLPYLSLAMWAVLLVTILIILFGFGRSILSKNRDPLNVEIAFWTSLIVVSVLGLIVSLSLGLFAPAFASDPTSFGLLLPLSNLHLSFLSTVMFLVALVILVAEGIYFFTWSQRIEKEREDMIEELRAKHRETLGDLATYIADALALHMLQRAELTDGTGGAGKYQYRMEQLNDCLNVVLEESRAQHVLAANRLSREDTPSVIAPLAKKPTLIIRDELLDMKALMINFQRLQDGLASNREEIVVFAEALLRLMGEETAAVIEQELREKPFFEGQAGKHPLHESREQHEAHVLMTMSAAAALRLSTAPPQTDSVLLLSERYKELDYHNARQLSRLKPAIDMLQERVSVLTLAQRNGTLPEGQQVDLATIILTGWVQALWEHAVPELDEVFMPGGVIAKLVKDGHSPQTVESRLGIRANLGGRPALVGQEAEFYLLVFPSKQGRRFLQDMRLEPYTYDFPDVERLLWLYVQHYAVEPYFVKEEPEPVVAQLGPGSVQAPDVDVSPTV